MRNVRIVAAGIAIAALLGVAWLARKDPLPEPSRALVPAQMRRPAVDVSNARVAGEVRRILASDEAAGRGFLVIDKREAELFVFDGDGSLHASTPVLLGSARGDYTVPGIGDRPIAQVLPHERTTPAGRFLGELGRNARNEDVVWVDYDAAVSIHRVLTTNPKERRMERLLSPTPDDNRISYGCINVLPDFYERYIRPEFVGRRSPIYILPEETGQSTG